MNQDDKELMAEIMAQADIAKDKHPGFTDATGLATTLAAKYGRDIDEIKQKIIDHYRSKGLYPAGT